MTDGTASPEAVPGGRLARTRLEAHQNVEQEIRRAQAEALGRTGERLADLLSRLADLDREIDRLVGPPADRTAALVERERLRQEAATAHHHLCIQREALGLVRHGLVDERYPVPPRRALRRGPTEERHE